ncbi:DNA-directed RNA polymerase II subunit RPB7-like [Teleopsis dalmanni]|uniref:DNA-directed RNA polymerase II subunit RPB7-like n=1 Tax=Teleopsis dalmanni TaxID=139649 RepID=UPI0018CFB77D|nr:DNA-directed RNA polymerase II subunit RPB7-like [Teleopsis dalmanni]
MYCLVELKHKIYVEPCYLDEDVMDHIMQNLCSHTEGQLHGDNGKIIKIIKIVNLGTAFINPYTSEVEIWVTFIALVLRPVKGEVVDAVITQVTSMGLFADVGCINHFISRFNIPEYLQYSTANAPCYKDKDERIVIYVGDIVRVQVTGVRSDNDIFAVATMLGDYQGTVQMHDDKYEKNLN